MNIQPGSANEWNPPFRPALIYFTTRPSWCEFCGSFSAHSLRCPYRCPSGHPTITIPVIGPDGKIAYRMPLRCEREHHNGDHCDGSHFALYGTTVTW